LIDVAVSIFKFAFLILNKIMILFFKFNLGEGMGAKQKELYNSLVKKLFKVTALKFKS